MEPRRVDIFFYGLFMDEGLLRSHGADPVNPRMAQVRGMRLRIGRRAALEEDPDGFVYGILMQLTHAEIERLYAEPSVAVYRPEAVIAEPPDGSRVPALCYNLPVAPRPDERNPAYATALRELAGRLDLPRGYVDSIF